MFEHQQPWQPLQLQLAQQQQEEETDWMTEYLEEVKRRLANPNEDPAEQPDKNRKPQDSQQGSKTE